VSERVGDLASTPLFQDNNQLTVKLSSLDAYPRVSCPSRRRIPASARTSPSQGRDAILITAASATMSFCRATTWPMPSF
jgi:hypothetical protein